MADAAANRCIDNHMASDAFDGELKALKAHRAYIRNVVNNLAECRELAGPAPKPKRIMRAWLLSSKQATVKQHDLSWMGSHFACKLCFRRFPQLPSVVTSCCGHPRAGIGAITTASKHGHKPVIACMQGPKQGFLIACIRCGAYSFDRIALLAKPCSGNLGLRSTPLVRLAKGRHPYCKQSFVTRLWSPGVTVDGLPRLIPRDTAMVTGGHPGVPPAVPAPIAPFDPFDPFEPIDPFDDEYDTAGLADFFGLCDG